MTKVRARANGPLRTALIQLVAGAAAFAVVDTVLIYDANSSWTWLIASYALVGLAYLVVGAVAWDRRPSNRTGTLLCVAGFLIMGAALANVQSTLLAGLGFLLAVSPIAAVLHLLLAFPSGRLPDGTSRALVTAGYLVCVVPQVPRYVYSSDPQVMAALGRGARPAVVGAAQLIENSVGSAVLLISALVLVRRLRATRTVTGERRVLTGVYAYGTVTILSLPFDADLLGPLLNLSPIVVFLLQVTALLGIPFVFTAALLRGGFARTAEIEELGAWLGTSDGARPSLRDALADTLGDASLQLLFRPGPGSLIDSAGSAVAGLPERTQRGTVVVPANGRTGPGSDGSAAVIVYDTSLIADPALVEEAGRVVALALDRERLTAELIAGRQALLESRARIVEIGDRERRRFAHDLHDLLQSRLVLAAIDAGQLVALGTVDAATRAAATRLRLDLEEAISELRRLVHGVMPALLMERGLLAAVEELADRLPVATRVVLDDAGLPIPAAVSSTCYFILAEALANAVKHAHASRIDLRIARIGDQLHLEVGDDGVGGAVATGAGLRGMADRVDALAGQLVLHSPPGGGTRVLVGLPCGS